MDIPEFTSRRAAAQSADGEDTAQDAAAAQGPAGGQIMSFTFRLDGQEFTSTLRDDADAALEWSELAILATDGIDAASPEAAAGIGRMLRLAFEPAEYRRLRRHMRDNRTPLDTLMDLLAEINQRMEDLVEQSAARPTDRPSPSSGGRGAKDEPRSPVASLPQRKPARPPARRRA